MNHSDVTISVLTYTAIDKCKRLMELLLAEKSGAKFFLTANGDKQVSAYFRRLQETHPEISIHVVHNYTNQGFIAPNNLAFGNTDTPFFVLINDDAIPPPGWLDMLKAPFVDPLMAVTGARGTCQTLDERFIGRPGNMVDYIEASCMMIRREHIVGDLFSSYLHFAYTEDADLCLRLRERGLKIAQADFKLVEHFRNTTSRMIPGIRHLMEQNFATCRKRWSYYLQHRKFEREVA